MGWYAEFCYMNYWVVECFDFNDHVQFFIDCMTIKDDGEHYRGEFPK